MAYDIGPKIGVDGEEQFRKQIRAINESYKTLASEAKVVASEFIGNEKSMEALAARSGVLEKEIGTLTDKLELQKKILAESTAAYGANDEKTLKWQQTVNATQTALNKTQAELRQTTEEMQHLGEAEDENGGKTSSLKDKLADLGITMTVDLVSAAKAAADAVAALAKWMVDTARDSAAFADDILTMSTNFGISTEELQEYSYMAELVDTDLGTITSSITRLTKNMDAARGGTGDAADAFRLLGINIFDADGTLKDASEVFDLAIERLSQLEAGTERDTLSMTLFGKGAMELNSLIAAGADGFEKFRQEAHETGYVLSGEELKALGAVDDQFQRLDKAMDAAKNQIALELAPAIIDISQKFLDWAKTVDWQLVGDVIIGMFKGIGFAIEALVFPITQTIEGIKDLINLVKGAGDWLGKIFGGSSSSINVSAAAAAPTPTAAYYGGDSQPLVVDITQEIDGEVLARNQYSLNLAEQRRRGNQMVR